MTQDDINMIALDFIEKLATGAQREHPGPWVVHPVSADAEDGIDFITDANGDNVVEGESGIYEPSGDTARMIGALHPRTVLALVALARRAIRPAVLGPAGEAFECPLHGRFIPAERPRYYPDEPEAKCMAWLPGGVTYCGRFCPPAKVQP